MIDTIAKIAARIKLDIGPAAFTLPSFYRLSVPLVKTTPVPKMGIPNRIATSDR